MCLFTAPRQMCFTRSDTHTAQNWKETRAYHDKSTLLAPCPDTQSCSVSGACPTGRDALTGWYNTCVQVRVAGCTDLCKPLW